MRVFFQPRKSRFFDPIRAAKTLIADDGALARLPGPVALVKASGAVVCANQAAECIATLLGAAEQRLAAAVADAIAAGDARTMTLTLPAASGGDDSQIELSILPLAKGEAALVVGQTARASASAGATVTAHRRYKDLLSLTGDFAWETSADGVFIFVSNVGGFGWRAEELVGRRAAEFLAEPPSGVDPFAARVPVSGVPLVLRRADGGSATISVAAVPVLAADGTFVGVRGIARDDGQRRQELRDHRIAELLQLVHDDGELAAMPKTATG